LKGKDGEFRPRFPGVQDRLAANYEDTVSQVLAKYQVAARAAYRRLRALHPDAVQEVGESEFARRFVEEISRHIPSRQAFYDSFYFEAELEYIPLPSLLAQEQAEVERIELQRRLERERAWAEEEKIRAEVDAARSAAEWKERLMREMHREVVEQARRKKEQVVDSFLRDVVAQLRTLVYEAVTDVLAALQKNGRLHSRSVVQLRNLIEQVERLNFAGDADLDAMIAEVRAELDVAAKDRNVQEIERALRDIAVITRSTLIGLGEQPRSARALGVPDEPGPALVRTARGRLGLDESRQALPLPEMPAPRRQRAAFASPWVTASTAVAPAV